MRVQLIKNTRNLLNGFTCRCHCAVYVLVVIKIQDIKIQSDLHFILLVSYISCIYTSYCWCIKFLFCCFNIWFANVVAALIIIVFNLCSHILAYSSLVVSYIIFNYHNNVLKVSELNHSVKEMAYQESLRVKYEMCRGGEAGVWRRSGKSSEIR